MSLLGFSPYTSSTPPSGSANITIFSAQHIVARWLDIQSIPTIMSKLPILIGIKSILNSFPDNTPLKRNRKIGDNKNPQLSQIKPSDFLKSMLKQVSTTRVGEFTANLMAKIGSCHINGLYTVNLQGDNKEIYHISKRSKDIEDQTYLWHCRLGHINKKRVELLPKGGFLGTFDFKTF
ncbi:hypothetical protein OSB04_020026 [Centaurea solstitialis]|uniref:GAG-pre-integrase domain-containing protein n=1 Tax=Centaurea solstitialis TaxID=347529 RepID=A0AA38SRY1_9ASTR|nr:hypothetical protein OSB04_020026 [Centaurea solstitialis]